MKNHLSKLSLVLIGFIGGVAFLISCGGDSTTTSLPGLPINDADAATAGDVWSQIVPAGSGISNEYIVSDDGMVLSDITVGFTLRASSSNTCHVYINGTNTYTLTDSNRLNLGVGVVLNQSDSITMDCYATNLYYPTFTVAGYM